MQIREVTEAEAAAEEEDGVEYVDFNVAGVGQQRLTLRTAVMEDKLNACTMIVEYGQPTPPRCCQATSVRLRWVCSVVYVCHAHVIGCIRVCGGSTGTHRYS